MLIFKNQLFTPNINLYITNTTRSFSDLIVALGKTFSTVHKRQHV